MNIALGMLLLVTSLAADVPARDGGHVRSIDPHMRAVIDEGLARSPLFRDLVAQLDASDVIVYIEPECAMSQRFFGRLAFMGTGGERRYLNIRIACRLNVQEMIAALGHELRHAVEIADTPSVVDVASLGDRYRRIGFPARGMPKGSGYETRAAIDAAQQIWAELERTAE
jgi:hypothetical protein